ATVIQLSASGLSLAAPLYDNLPSFGGDSQNVFYQAVREEMQHQGEGLDDIFDENLMTEDLRKFVDKLLDGKLKPEQYQAERLKLNFRRDPDGRVSLRSRQGAWFSVRPDMQVPGFLLLRDQSSGAVFFLPPDPEGDGLAQMDLSDDLAVAQLFSNTAWQDVMAPLSYRDGSEVTQLRMSEGDFRMVASLVEGAEEEAEEEAGQQQQQEVPAAN
ncbi:hypothetical protein Agub_g1242, partial [Astrephomene gubernaculifera]